MAVSVKEYRNLIAEEERLTARIQRDRARLVTVRTMRTGKQDQQPERETMCSRCVCGKHGQCERQNCFCRKNFHG